MTSERLMNPKGSVLDAFQVELLTGLQPYGEEARFSAGEKIFARGERSEAFYVVDEGEVRLESHSEELDTDSVLDYVGAGSFLGEVSLLGGNPHSLNAVAHTDVVARRFSTDGLKRLFKEDPGTGVDVLRSLARDVAGKLQRANERLSEQAADEARDPEVDTMVARAVAAQREFESWDEERVDKLLEAVAQAVAARAEELAQASVEQTHIGNPADKAMKIQFASLGVYAAMAGKPGFGPLAEESERRVTEIASPVGVIVGLVPVTNPVPTFINKTLIALKSRNAIILSCHRMAQELGNTVGEIIQEVLDEHGAPEGIVQWIRQRTSRRKTAKFMRHEDVGLILATGGPAMVKAAYSSGKPAIGVGAGNAPAWVAADADVQRAAKSVVDSKAFDYGLICGSEQHLVVDVTLRDVMVEALEANDAVVLDEDETARFIAGAFDAEGDLLLQFVGQAAGKIAQAVGLERGHDARLLVFCADSSNPQGAQARERLAPVLSLFTVDGDEEGFALCRALLEYEGSGHTANIHTEDPARVERFAREMPASRVLVNAPSAMGCCGVVTGLEPSLTLGCGTFGGNSTTDNVTHANLRNVKRLAHVLG
ncbi:MAG: aldehyde dehydrogenase family protein [Thermoleophilaceae bacterium]